MCWPRQIIIDRSANCALAISFERLFSLSLFGWRWCWWWKNNLSRPAYVNEGYKQSSGTVVWPNFLPEGLSFFLRLPQPPKYVRNTLCVRKTSVTRQTDGRTDFVVQPDSWKCELEERQKQPDKQSLSQSLIWLPKFHPLSFSVSLQVLWRVVVVVVVVDTTVLLVSCVVCQIVAKKKERKT